MRDSMGREPVDVIEDIINRYYELPYSRGIARAIAEGLDFESAGQGLYRVGALEDLEALREGVKP